MRGTNAGCGDFSFGISSMAAGCGKRSRLPKRHRSWLGVETAHSYCRRLLFCWLCHCSSFLLSCAALNRRLLLQRSLTVLCVGLAFLWVFRIRRDGTASSVKSVKTRTAASLLLALLVPPGGDVPLGAALLGAPTLLVHRGGAWLLPLVLVLSLYCACAVVIYYLLTLSVRLLARESRYVAQL